MIRIEFLVSLAGMVHTAKFAKVEFGEETPGSGFMWGKKDCRYRGRLWMI